MGAIINGSCRGKDILFARGRGLCALAAIPKKCGATPASTTTELTSSANPSSVGQTVTFTATLTSSAGVNPFGTVTFTAGDTTLGTVALSSGAASISTASLPGGSTLITATYNGADSFTGSSASLTQVVQ